MQKYFEVKTSTGQYRVEVGEEAIDKSRRLFQNSIFICDRNISSYLPSGMDPIFIEAVEENKSLEFIPQIIRELRARKVDRGFHLVAIGGGITQDISTFVASIFMRGLKWTYIPTTLLGMVDSCIGGKSSINVGDLKNMVGNFFPPENVFVDVGFLPTLDQQDIVGGLCEAVKICYARSHNEFLAFVSEGEGLPVPRTRAENIITRSLNVKRWFIEIDEFDQKERLQLNFGHTFGHALESATSYSIKHGVGVGIGMLVAIEFRRSLGGMSPTGRKRCADLCDYIRRILFEVHGLHEKVQVDPDLLFSAFEHDKKHRAEEYRLILPTDDGSLGIVPVAKTEKSRQLIIDSYLAAFKLLEA